MSSLQGHDHNPERDTNRIPAKYQVHRIGDMIKKYHMAPWFLVLLALHVLLMEHRHILLLEPGQVVDHKDHAMRNPGWSLPSGPCRLDETYVAEF
jgi:hypothetical protein